MNCLSLVEHIIEIVLTLSHQTKYWTDDGGAMMNLTKL